MHLIIGLPLMLFKNWEPRMSVEHHQDSEQL